MTDGEMRNVVFSSTTNNIVAMLGLIRCISLLFAASIVLVATEKVFAAGQFTIESKTNTQNINGPFKLKLISSANGDTKAKKTGVIAEANPGSISIPWGLWSASNQP
jgi:hypothetical protein